MAKNPEHVRKDLQRIEITPEQIMEVARCSRDIVHFCETYVRIQHPVRGSIPFDLYPYQIKMLKAYQDNTNIVVLSARQTGKSITSAIYLLWYALFHDDQNILIASNKNDGAMEMISRIKHAYEALPLWLKPGVKDDGYNKHTIIFENDSKIDSVATSESSGRGKSISLLFLDEFAFVKPGVQTEFWASILPTLSTGGSCIMTSTPNGDENLFAQIWRSAELGLSMNKDLVDEANAESEDGEEFEEVAFYPIQVKWDEPPDRGEAFKRRQVAQLGELLWRQEYECEFLSSDALLIDTTILQLISDRDVFEPINVINGFNFWEDIKQAETYIIGIDPATGTGKDFSVIQVFHFPSMRQVAEFRSNTMSSPEVYVKLKWILDACEKRSCTCYFSVENNGVGEGIIALFLNDEHPPEFSEFISADGQSNRLGFVTGSKTKMKACVDLKQMIERNKMNIRSSITVKELKNFVRKKDSYNAQIGSTDDSICAILICIRILAEIAAYEQDAFDKLYTYSEEAENQTAYRDSSVESEYDYAPMLIGDGFDPTDSGTVLDPTETQFANNINPNNPYI